MSDPQERAAEDAQDRVNKAAYINAQLAERLPQADDEQPGVKPAKDARTEYPTAKPARTVKPAADKA